MSFLFQAWANKGVLIAAITFLGIAIIKPMRELISNIAVVLNPPAYAGSINFSMCWIKVKLAPANKTQPPYPIISLKIGCLKNEKSSLV